MKKLVNVAFALASLLLASVAVADDLGKTLEKGANDGAKAVETAGKDAGKWTDKAAKDTGKAVDSAAKDTAKWTDKAAKDTGDAAKKVVK
ncbi:MAG: hypothetical protein WB493_16990 [Anaeromyxobacteraceae bacterium]